MRLDVKQRASLLRHCPPGKLFRTNKALGEDLRAHSYGLFCSSRTESLRSDEKWGSRFHATLSLMDRSTQTLIWTSATLTVPPGRKHLHLAPGLRLRSVLFRRNRESAELGTPPVSSKPAIEVVNKRLFKLQVKKHGHRNA